MAQIKNITLGTKYVDRKNDKRIGEVTEVNEKTKTVTLQFEDGKTRPFVVTTLSKSFAKLDAVTEKADDVAEEKEPEVTVGDTPLEDVAGDGTPLAEVGKEIAEQAKQKAEEHKKLNESAKKTSEIINKAEAKEEAEKKPKKEKKPSKPKKESGVLEEERIKLRDSWLKEFKKLDIDAVIPDKYPLWINIKIGEKNAFGIGLSSNHIRVRSLSAILPKDIEFKNVKGGFDATINIEYSNSDAVLGLIKYALDNFKTSDVLKKKSRVKKEAKAE